VYLPHFEVVEPKELKEEISTELQVAIERVQLDKNKVSEDQLNIKRVIM